jgi:hypothetical protein
MRTRTSNLVATALAGSLIVGTMISPVGAHVTDSLAHLFDHTDARYDRLSVGDHATVKSVAGATVTLTNQEFVDSPPIAQVSFTVPPGQKWFTMVTFSAESVCYAYNPFSPAAPNDGQTLGSAPFCEVTLRVDGQEDLERPDTDDGFAFDSTNADQESGASWEAHSMTWRTLAVGPGDHQIRVRGAVFGDAALRLDESTLRVDAYIAEV